MLSTPLQAASFPAQMVSHMVIDQALVREFATAHRAGIGTSFDEVHMLLLVPHEQVVPCERHWTERAVIPAISNKQRKQITQVSF